MKLEKFDLEKALNGAKVVTNQGKEVTQLHFFSNVKGPYVLYGCIENGVARWTEDGCFLDYNSKHYNDLFIETEIISIWVNLYSTIDGGIILGHSFKIKEDAEYDGKSNSFYIKTIEITDEP